MNRSKFLKVASIASVALPISSFAEKIPELAKTDELPNWPLLDLKAILHEPILLKSVELLKTQGQLMLVVTAEDGTRGVTQCNDRMKNLYCILKNLVLPHFINADARDIVALTENAYQLNSNYKYAGMPLWNCIGSVEIAVWDLLGKVAKRPVYELLGKPVRDEYGVYISDWYRGGEPIEGVIDRLTEKLAVTGAKGIKIKVGGRMQNTPLDSARTKIYIPLLRKKFGNSLTIYADGNGSFTPAEGIATGKFLTQYGVSIFEEPCNFEDEEGIRTVNKSLKKIVLAGGEQDSSLYRFSRLAQTDVYDLLQPDLYYNGGIMRTLNVAEIARKNGKSIAPHTPKADPMIAPFWQVAALIPNLYGLQEFVYNPGQESPSWYTPNISVRDGQMKIPDKPGLGIQYDEGIWKNAEKII